MTSSRHQLTVWVGATIAVLLGGCFPEYSYAPDDADAAVSDGSPSDGREGGAPLVEDMVLITPTAAFEFTTTSFDGPSPGTMAVTFSHPFSIDRYEVTVRRYRKWVQAGRPLPEAGQQLDPGGTFPWVWDGAWDASEHGFDPITCFKPVDGTSPNTWEVAEIDGNDTYPMTCVNWYEAVAFCAFEHKRLPTHAEWVYVASSASEEDLYPWGGQEEPSSCAFAIFNNPAERLCDFPQPVGSAPAGMTPAGVHDLAGSVFEWVWDVDWMDEAAFPAVTVDYAGPVPAEPERRTRKGGAYIVPESPGDPRLENFTYEAFEPGDVFGDAGFRCARTETGR